MELVFSSFDVKWIYGRVLLNNVVIYLLYISAVLNITCVGNIEIIEYKVEVGNGPQEFRRAHLCMEFRQLHRSSTKSVLRLYQHY